MYTRVYKSMYAHMCTLTRVYTHMSIVWGSVSRPFWEWPGQGRARRWGQWSCPTSSSARPKRGAAPGLGHGWGAAGLRALPLPCRTREGRASLSAGTRGACGLGRAFFCCTGCDRPPASPGPVPGPGRAQSSLRFRWPGHQGHLVLSFSLPADAAASPAWLAAASRPRALAPTQQAAHLGCLRRQLLSRPLGQRPGPEGRQLPP